MSRTVRKTNNGERSDKDAYTKNKKARKWNKEKSIKLKNIDYGNEEDLFSFS